MKAPDPVRRYWSDFASKVWPSDQGPFSDWDWYADKLDDPGGFPDLLWDYQGQRYNSMARTLQGEFGASLLWRGIWEELRNRDYQYRQEKNPFRLLPDSDRQPFVDAKTWESFAEKLYRKNRLNNDRWPYPPEGGWITPDDWSKDTRGIADVVRTTVVVRYLDCVSIVRNVVAAAVKQHGGQDFHQEEAARLEGYYALHLTFSLQLPSAKIPIEIQVCTQVQEVLRTLTHQFYVRRRLDKDISSEQLMWDYGGRQFVPCYLGHLLHYADGQIMNVRDREQREEEELLRK